jgi:hypothetical protein
MVSPREQHHEILKRTFSKLKLEHLFPDASSKTGEAASDSNSPKSNDTKKLAKRSKSRPGLNFYQPGIVNEQRSSEEKRKSVMTPPPRDAPPPMDVPPPADCPPPPTDVPPPMDVPPPRDVPPPADCPPVEVPAPNDCPSPPIDQCDIPMCQPRFFPQFISLNRDKQSESKIEESSKEDNLPTESCEVKNIPVNETSKVKDTAVDSVKEEVKVLPTVIVIDSNLSEPPTRCDLSDVPFVKITQPDEPNEITVVVNETPGTSNLATVRKSCDISLRNSSDMTFRKSSEFTVVVNMPAYTNDVVTVRRASDQEVRKLPDRPGRRPSDLAAKKSSDTIVRKSSEQMNVRKPVDLHIRKNSDLAAKKSSEVTIRKSNEKLPFVKISDASDVTQKEPQVVESRTLSRGEFSRGSIKPTNNVIKFPSLETPEKVIEPVGIEQKKTPTISLDDMINFHVISPARSSPVSLGLLPTLSTYSSKLCHRCVQAIPEGVPSILFHNRTYHSRCYYCSHCRVSLFEHRAFHHQNDLYCADCHFVINIEFTPPKN